MWKDSKLFIGERLRQLMAAAGYDPASRSGDRTRLAKDADVSYSYLSNLLIDERHASLDTLVKLSRPLGVSPSAFITEDPVEPTGSVSPAGEVLAEQLPGWIVAEAALERMGIPAGALLLLRPAKTVQSSGWYVVARRGAWELCGWDGQQLTANDGEKFLFSAEIHSIVARVVSVQFAPLPPE